MGQKPPGNTSVSIIGVRKEKGQTMNIDDTYEKGWYDLQDCIESLPSAEPKIGEWILVKGSNGKYYHKCSKCLHTQEITGVKNYCAVCGAKMVREDGE